MLPEGLILVSWTAFVVGNVRSPTISTFWFPFIFVRAVFMRMCFTTLNTQTLALETLLDRGHCPKFLDLENYASFLAYKSPEMSASACFGLSHFILIRGRSLLASAQVILLNSSSSLKSDIVTFVDTSLGLFSTGQNFPCGMIFSFVFDAHSPPIGQ